MKREIFRSLSFFINNRFIFIKFDVNKNKSVNKKLHIYNIWMIFIAGIILSSCNTKHRIWVGEKGEQKIFNLKYGEDKKQVMDIFLSEKYNPESPAVIIIHGGSWKYGRKEHMIMIQKYLFQNNIPTININYRLVSNRKKITYKNQLADISSAIEKFNKIAPKAKLSANNYILLGESAGAHLALLYGYKNPHQIKKIISMSGPTDFYTETYTNSLYSKYTLPTIEDVVGEKFNRKNISPKFVEASPIAHVSNVPTLIFQGDTDIMVNKNQGIKLNSILEEKNIPHQFIFMKNTGHTPRFYSKHKRDSIILPKILEWIKKGNF